MKKLSTRSWVVMAMMTATSIVLSRFLSFETNIVRISLGYIPIILTGILLGPVAGGTVGFVADFIGAMFLSSRGWFPPLALTPLFIGVWSGLMRNHLFKSSKWWQIILQIILINFSGNIIGRVFITSLCLSYLQGMGLMVILASRIPQCIIMTIIESEIIYLMLKVPVINAVERRL